MALGRSPRHWSDLAKISLVGTLVNRRRGFITQRSQAEGIPVQAGRGTRFTTLPSFATCCA